MRDVRGATQPSIFTRLIGWLKSLGAEETSEKLIDKPRANNPPRRERESRSPSGNRSDSNRPEGNRQRNNPRRDRDEAQPRIEKTVQTTSKTQEPRAARPPRPPRVPVETAVLESITKVATITGSAEENSQSTGRKRGRRGGQRERERRDQQAAGQLAGEQPILAETTPSAVMNAVETTRHSEPAEPQNIQNIEPRPLPVEPTITSTTSFQASTTANGNELVQIETDAVKRSSAAAAAQVEATPSASRRRSRPREIFSMENNEPLVQIETQQT
jgi:ribonuclease E